MTPKIHMIHRVIDKDDNPEIIEEIVSLGRALDRVLQGHSFDAAMSALFNTFVDGMTRSCKADPAMAHQLADLMGQEMHSKIKTDLETNDNQNGPVYVESKPSIDLVPKGKLH